MNAIAQEQAQAPLTPFEAGIRLNDLQRKADGSEIDLVPVVRGILIKVGLTEDAVAVCYDGNRHVKAAQNRVPVVQRTHLNRFFELSLISSVKSTQGLRAELLPNGSIEQWLEIVENKVAPFMQEHKLLG